MAQAHLRTVIRYLHRLTAGPDTGSPPDRQLLERFAALQDEDAFATLVERHGALVWGVCWRALRHAQDAEDCFQATFLVLARKAGSVRWRDSVANWLYGVASRVAAEAKARRARCRAREVLVPAMLMEKPMTESAARELCATLDDELQALPDKYRAPLLLCYLEGRTADQAARQLDWSLRTLQRRLSQGKELLRARLSQRGVTLCGALLGVALSEEAARAALPAGLAALTTKAVISLATGGSAPVLFLADAVMKVMTMKLKLTTVVVFLLSATVGGSVLLARAAVQPREPGTAAAGLQTPQREPAQVPAKRDEDNPRADDLAGRLWAILELVEKNHVKPPARAEMVLAGARGLLQVANVTPPEDLTRRAAAVASEDQLRTLLRDLWPKEGPARAATAGKLESAVLEGVFASIPGKPHLLTATEVKRMDAIAGNRYVGIGIQIAAHKSEQLPQITLPIRGGVAHRAGVQPGDLLLKVDGKSTEGMVNLEQVVALLQGEEGTPVTIVVRQPGSTEERTVRMTRAVIPFDSLFGFRRTSGEGWDYLADREARIGYVWVSSISSSTLHELQQLERRLLADGARALVLDFRLSSGQGNLHHASLVADGLLDGGLMWTTTGKEERAYRADRDCLFRGWPLAVLVSDLGDNAQGAVLAALQDNRRAVLVGEPTKVDGSIRRLVHLPNQAGALTVLTGRLERSDKSRDWPVHPDRLVELTKEQRAAVEKWLRAKHLPTLPPGTDDKPPSDPQFDGGLIVVRDALKALDLSGKPKPDGKE
jgi:C-terminal peptidase prc